MCYTNKVDFYLIWCNAFQKHDLSQFRPVTAQIINLLAHRCSSVPLAVLRGVEEPVLTGEATELHGCTSSTSQCNKMGPNCLVMVTDGTSQFKCPKMIIFFSVCDSSLSSLTTLVVNSWQQCAATRLLLCQCVSEVADPSIILGQKCCTGEVTWLSTCRAETASPHNISCFTFWRPGLCHPVRGQEKELVGGGEGAERIQFHSWADPSGSPAWVGKDFTPEVEDGITFLHCYCVWLSSPGKTMLPFRSS